MVIRTQESLKIEDLRNHSTEQMAALRGLLAAGALAQPDTHRADFFEVSDAATTFYIYVSPVNGRILLVAAWPKENGARTNGSGRAAA